MTHTEARALASQFGTRMCDENGDTHGEELYCFDLDDIIALKETLAQPEQEPVAWMYVNTDGECEQIEYGEPFDDPSTTPLYTTAPQRTEQEPVQEIVPEGVITAIRNEGLTLVKDLRGYRLMRLGKVEAQATPPQRTEQEPVAILNHAHGVHTFRNVNLKGLPDGEYLIYTHPAQRTWVGLTFAEICECENDYLHLFARAIEAKLKQKNGYAEEKNT